METTTEDAENISFTSAKRARLDDDDELLECSKTQVQEEVNQQVSEAKQVEEQKSCVEKEVIQAESGDGNETGEDALEEPTSRNKEDCEEPLQLENVDPIILQESFEVKEGQSIENTIVSIELITPESKDQSIDESRDTEITEAFNEDLGIPEVIEFDPEPEETNTIQKQDNEDIEDGAEPEEAPTHILENEGTPPDIEDPEPEEVYIEPDYSYEMSYFPTETLSELASYSWDTSIDNQQYTKGCIWSPDGTCCLVGVNGDGK